MMTLKQTLFQSRLNALNAECMNYFHQVHLRVTMIKIMIMIMIMIMITMMIKIIHSSNENNLQDISPSFYHVQKPKAFLRPIITNLGNECIDPNISAENRQRSVQWITTELRKQTARLDLMIKMTKTYNQNDKDVKFNRFLKESSREKQPYREQSVRPFCKTGWRNLIIFMVGIWQCHIPTPIHYVIFPPGGNMAGGNMLVSRRHHHHYDDRHHHHYNDRHHCRHDNHRRHGNHHHHQGQFLFRFIHQYYAEIRKEMQSFIQQSRSITRPSWTTTFNHLHQHNFQSIMSFLFSERNHKSLSYLTQTLPCQIRWLVSSAPSSWPCSCSFMIIITQGKCANCQRVLRHMCQPTNVTIWQLVKTWSSTKNIFPFPNKFVRI